MDAALLDTDMLSELIKQRDRQVKHRGSDYLRSHGQFVFSAFSRFEIIRGYYAKGAVRQLTKFNEFCRRSNVLSVTDPILEQAAILWSQGRTLGRPCGDADLIIAATALAHDLYLVTGNASHFEWVAGLRIDDWRKK